MLPATIALAASGCSSDELSTRDESTSSAAASSAAPTSTTTTVDPATVLAGLPSCADMPPPPETASAPFRTLPDWVPADLPDRYEVTEAETYGPPTADGSGSADSVLFTRWLLAELDGDRVVATISVTRGSTDPDGYAQPGFNEVTDERALDWVRGHPGRVSRWINRGDPVGEQVAEWTEDGDRWLATSALDVDELAAALGALSIDGTELRDPTGRFQVLGRRRGDTATGELAGRTTSLRLTEHMEDDEPDLGLSLKIEQRPPDLEGFVDVRVRPGSLRIEVDGRPAMRSSPERNDAWTYLATTLPDGSLLSITWHDVGTAERTMDDATIQRIDASLRQVVASMRPRSDADDDLMALLATQSDVNDVLPMCMER